MENFLKTECEHSNHPTKTMTVSWLDGRVKLIADITASVATVTIDGDIKLIEKDATISMIERLERQCDDVARSIMKQ